MNEAKRIPTKNPALPERPVPPPITPELKEHIEKLQKDTTDARQTLNRWKNNREKASQIAPDSYGH